MRAGLRTPAIALFAVAVAACQRAEPPAPAPAAVAAPAPEPPAPPADDQLFGMTTLAGLELEERGPRHAHFVMRGDMATVVAELRALLTGFSASESPDGAKFESPDGSGRSVYVYRRRGARDVVLVSYFGPVERDAEGRAVAATAGDGAAAPGRAGTATLGAGRVVAAATPAGIGDAAAPGMAAASGSVGEGGTAGAGGAAAGGSSGGGTAGGGTPTGGSSGGGGTDGTAGAGAAGGGAAPGGSPPVVTRRLQPFQRSHRGTTNPGGRPPLNLTRGEYEPPRNPEAYY